MELVPHLENEYKKQFYDLNIEYDPWVAERYHQVNNIDLEPVHGKSSRDFVRDFLQEFTSAIESFIAILIPYAILETMLRILVIL